MKWCMRNCCISNEFTERLLTWHAAIHSILCFTVTHICTAEVQMLVWFPMVIHEGTSSKQLANFLHISRGLLMVSTGWWESNFKSPIYSALQCYCQNNQSHTGGCSENKTKQNQIEEARYCYCPTVRQYLDLLLLSLPTFTVWMCC